MGHIGTENSVSGVALNAAAEQNHNRVRKPALETSPPVTFNHPGPRGAVRPAPLYSRLPLNLPGGKPWKIALQIQT